uniref:Uncharacterized protein n=1 Tax=Tetranychus urticae TaxID=32264 RepID=T1KE33_TETUR
MAWYWNIFGDFTDFNGRLALH